MRAHLIITTVVTIAALQASTLQAQQAPNVAARVALGVAYERGIFGDDDPRSHGETGLTIGGQLWKPLSGSKALVFEGTFQPNALENPHYDENVHVLHLQIGPQFGRRLYFRPTGGFAVRFWSGSQSDSGTDGAPAVGVAIGHRQAVGASYEASPEFFLRVSAPISGVTTWLLGLQVAVGPHRG
jgi:hypothetical protein